MAQPKITNPALVTRNEQFAVTSHCTIDGSGYQADTILPRGTLLVRSAIGGKYHAAVHGTDTLAPGMVRVLQDERRIQAGVDAFASAYVSGFMSLPTLLAANVGYTASDLAAGGIQQQETDEVWMK